MSTKIYEAVSKALDDARRAKGDTKTLGWLKAELFGVTKAAGRKSQSELPTDDECVRVLRDVMKSLQDPTSPDTEGNAMLLRLIPTLLPPEVSQGAVEARARELVAALPEERRNVRSTKEVSDALKAEFGPGLDPSLAGRLASAALKG